MKLSEEIFKKEKFPYVKANLFNGSVGYDPSAVELFMEDVAVKVEKIENENERLREQLKAMLQERELRGATPAPPLPSAPTTAPVVSHSAPIKSLSKVEMDSTNEMKEEIKKKLKQVETLERSYKRMIYIAEQDAQEITDESRKEARAVLEEAQEKAANLVREANNRFTEREREINVLNSKAEELKERLKNVAQFIEDAVS